MPPFQNEIGVAATRQAKCETNFSSESKKLDVDNESLTFKRFYGQE